VIDLTNEEINDLVFYTFRYCLGRKSYAVGDANKYIRKFITFLSDKNLYIIQKEIQKELQESTLDVTNMGCGNFNVQWLTTFGCITEEFDKRKEKIKKEIAPKE
jgi:uncharacterized protein YutD